MERGDAGCDEATRPALAAPDPGFFQWLCVTSSCLQRFGSEEPTLYAMLALDTDQSGADSIGNVVKGK